MNLKLVCLISLCVVWALLKVKTNVTKLHILKKFIYSGNDFWLPMKYRLMKNLVGLDYAIDSKYLYLQSFHRNLI